MRDYSVPNDEDRWIDYRTSKSIKKRKENAQKMKRLSWPEKGLFAMELSSKTWEKTDFSVLSGYGLQKPADYIDVYHSQEKGKNKYRIRKHDMYLIRCKNTLYHIIITQFKYKNGETDESGEIVEGEEVFYAMMLPLQG